MSCERHANSQVEFWTNRLAATEPPLEVSQTRIPEIPDQTEFLERWWEFHQGYRIAKMQDGTERRIAVIGEPFKEVSPGFLPRTLDQMRAGVQNDARRPENILRRRRLTAENERTDEVQQSLEQALDDMLNDASEDEEHAQAREQTASSASTQTPASSDPLDEPARPLTRREAQLQHARERFARLFGNREDVQQDDYESPLATMYSRADDRYRQAEARRAEGNTTAPPLDGLSAQERREIEEQLLWGVIHESQRLTEDLEPEGRVWTYAPWDENGIRERFEARAETLGLPSLSVDSNPDFQRAMHTLRDIHTSPYYGFDTPAPAPPSSTAPPSNPLTSTPTTLQPWNPANIRPSPGSALPTNPAESRVPSSWPSDWLTSRAAQPFTLPQPPPPITLDSQPERPPPKSEADMTKTLSCQVCYQQLADIAVLPCGHMVMCVWCADVVIPVKHGYVPRVPGAKCPMCRKGVKQRVRIHM